MLEAEGIGKTIEKAIEDALVALKAPREDVDIKILNEGGLFKKARVLVSISEDAKDKYIKREKVRKENEISESVEKTMKEVEKQVEKDVKKSVKQTEEETKKTQKEVDKEVKAEVQKIFEEANKKDYTPKQNKEEKTVEPMAFIEGFFKVLGREVTISTLEDEKYVTYNVEGEDLGDVIGRRGEAFYALSSLVSTLAGKTEKKVLIDVGSYRAKRAESLAGIARRMANKVAKSGRYMKLEPMNPSERRVIHTTLQDDDRVTTLSKGTEPHRYVIIFPKEYKDKP